MELSPEHLDALDQAEPLIQKRDYRRYLRLKELLPQQNENSRAEFRRIFKSYFGLNVANLGEQFLDAFFEALFQWNDNTDIAALLKKLYKIPTFRGRNTLQLSFVSKLAAINDESRPIYDKHVRNFFAVTQPGANKSIDDRIAWLIAFLNDVQAAYKEWIENGRVAQILNRLRERNPDLAGCNPVRLIDLLVWKIGNASILKKVKRDREIQALTAEIEAVKTIQGRIDLVAEDYHSGKWRYRDISDWKLAELLGLDFKDNADWDRTYWGIKKELDNDFYYYPYAENVHYLEDQVSKERFLELSEIAQEIEDDERKEDLPLTKEEIGMLEKAYSEEPPEFPSFEYVTTAVHATNGDPLHFSAIVGDAGAVEDPMSPYNYDSQFNPGDDYIEM